MRMTAKTMSREEYEESRPEYYNLDYRYSDGRGYCFKAATYFKDQFPQPCSRMERWEKIHKGE